MSSAPPGPLPKMVRNLFGWITSPMNRLVIEDQEYAIYGKMEVPRVSELAAKH